MFQVIEQKRFWLFGNARQFSSRWAASAPRARLHSLLPAAGGGERIFAVQCNFTPTCSHYAAGQSNASVCGAARLAWRRIRRCNRRDLLERIDDPLPERLP